MNTIRPRPIWEGSQIETSPIGNASEMLEARSAHLFQALVFASKFGQEDCWVGPTTVMRLAWFVSHHRMNRSSSLDLRAMHFSSASIIRDGPTLLAPKQATWLATSFPSALLTLLDTDYLLDPRWPLLVFVSLHTFLALFAPANTQILFGCIFLSDSCAPDYRRNTWCIPGHASYLSTKESQS